VVGKVAYDLVLQVGQAHMLSVLVCAAICEGVPWTKSVHLVLTALTEHVLTHAGYQRHSTAQNIYTTSMCVLWGRAAELPVPGQQGKPAKLNITCYTSVTHCRRWLFWGLDAPLDPMQLHQQCKHYINKHVSVLAAPTAHAMADSADKP
jgi:hypothetical protein